MVIFKIFIAFANLICWNILGIFQISFFIEDKNIKHIIFAIANIGYAFMCFFLIIISI